MKIYKASRRKSGSFKFSFCLRDDSGLFGSRSRRRRPKFSVSDANLTDSLAANLANLTNF
ncbi:hypothetical protein [Campylobacter showae]|uniref:Uncharacterized protein n=1 Tax=Campylobacter showae CSUNSWCD TaxID=1244083 RepID=M5IG66_9BACT|nr:hypothetical protein [Campylobacter showae]EKU11457.1 hypothetical protein CSUNSWCD_2083 [Campylobacter showae CSUNSWCD]